MIFILPDVDLYTEPGLAPVEVAATRNSPVLSDAMLFHDFTGADVVVQVLPPNYYFYHYEYSYFC